MANRFSYAACILLLPATIAMAEEKNNDGGDTKVLSGISIVGNSETPKSLTIIPWRSAQIGKETKLSPGPLNEELNPVDKAAFMRELDFYKASNPD